MKRFRADESAEQLRDEAINYLTRYLPPEARERSRMEVENIIAQHGPVVSCYPSWHPLVASSRIPEGGSPRITPGDRCGYRGLDHTRYLRNALITCPYVEGGIFESVAALEPIPCVSITAEKIDVPLYHPKAQPILITCKWERPLAADGSIPSSLAVPLLLETELPNWRHYEVGESWETMRRYILGQPCGSRSSLFVNQETGQTLKNLWNMLIETGMFGPIYVR